MATFSTSFRNQRIALSAGVKTAIRPPASFNRVSIGNATAGDLEVHTTDDNDTEYVVIAAGYERAIPAVRHLFDPAYIAFWLKAANSGTVVIVWH